MQLFSGIVKTDGKYKEFKICMFCTGYLLSFTAEFKYSQRSFLLSIQDGGAVSYCFIRNKNL